MYYIDRPCQYCGKLLTGSHQQIAGHTTNCSSNPNIEINRAKAIAARKISAGIGERNIVCKCGKTFCIVASDNEIERGKYKKYCSVKCGNSRPRTEEFKVRMSQLFSGRNGNKKPRPNCLTCGHPCKLPHNKFCSRACVRKSDEHKEQIRQRTIERHKLNPNGHPNILCANISETYPEKYFREWLEGDGLLDGIDFHRQYKFDRYYIDFYFPNLNVCVEIDGERFHKRNEKEISRENIIKQHFMLLRFSVKPLLKGAFKEIIGGLVHKAQMAGRFYG